MYTAQFLWSTTSFSWARWIDIQSLRAISRFSQIKEESWLFKHRMNINSLERGKRSVQGRGGFADKDECRPSFRMCRVLLHRVIFFNFLALSPCIPTRRFRKEIDASPSLPPGMPLKEREEGREKNIYRKIRRRMEGGRKERTWEDIQASLPYIISSFPFVSVTTCLEWPTTFL